MICTLRFDSRRNRHTTHFQVLKTEQVHGQMRSLTAGGTPSKRRLYTKASVILAFVLVAAIPRSLAAANNDVKLLDKGVCSHRIMLHAGASPSEETAAKELAYYFKACTGAELPIEHASTNSCAPSGENPAIVIGCGDLAEVLGVKPTAADLGEQGCLVRTMPPHIVFAGTSNGGTLWAVRRFLEEQMGVRWYTPTITKIPHWTDMTVNSTNRLQRPPFLWRDCNYSWPNPDNSFRARCGLNHGDAASDEGQGIQYHFDGRCHTYHRYISPDEYFDAHPEYFSEVNGKRLRDRTQLCLTNPDVLEIVTEKLLQRMKAKPTCRQYNFSQMDWYNYCECRQCREVNMKYRTSGGTQFWFVNELARRTSKIYPDKQISTLAYMYTEEPPSGLELHPNVAVWLCHMFPSCDSHPIESCPDNADYRRRAIAWSKICRHMCAWHYAVNFAHYYSPFPNFRALEADFAFYHRLGFEGIYAHAMGHRGGGGEFSLLRGYLLAELLKDPSRGVDATVRDFLGGYYGAAAGPIGEYIYMLHDKVHEDNVHMHLYTNPAQGYLTDELLQRADFLFDSAEAAVANSPEHLERVRVARMPVQYARMFPRNGYKFVDDQLVFQQPLSTLFENLEFVARMNMHGYKAVREYGGSPAEHFLLCNAMNHPIPLVVLENDRVRVDIVPFLSGRVLRIIDLESRRCITACNQTKNLTFPFCGGEESRISGDAELNELSLLVPTKVVTQTDESVTLLSEMNQGLVVHRTISLLDSGKGVRIHLHVQNVDSRPRNVQLHSLFSLDQGTNPSVGAEFTSQSGAITFVDADDVIAGKREGIQFDRSNAPDGKWAFIDRKTYCTEPSRAALRKVSSIELIQRFDRDEVDSVRLKSYPSDSGELEVTLSGKPHQLDAGAMASLKHELEIQ